MYIDTIVAILSGLASIGTLIAAIATLQTVKEMKKQREVSYKPDLHPQDFEIKIIQHYLLQDGRISFQFHKDNSLSPDRELHLYNLGFGVAKDIHTEWIINYQPIITLIEANEIYNKYNLELSENSLTIAWGNHYKNFHAIKPDLHSSANFLFPSKDLIIPIEIPYVYLLLNTLYANSFNLDGRHHPLPHIQLEISYKDISGESHYKKMKLHLELKENLQRIDPTYSHNIHLGTFHVRFENEVESA